MRFYVIVAVSMLVSMMSYVAGLRDADFDRVNANLKLQNCLDVIKKEN
jgi:hypothetical protein